jgi:hypothetical protein
MDEESRRRNAELRKRADIARLEVALGEDIGGAERREREARELEGAQMSSPFRSRLGIST